MDPAIVNALIVISLALLALAAVLLAGTCAPVLYQAHRTMIAYERLAATLNNEVPATLNEFKQLAQRVNALGSITTQQVTEVGHKVEAVSGSIGHAAGNAKKQGSVWGSALLAGVKSYLTPASEEIQGDPAAHFKQITKNRGEDYAKQ